MSPDGSSGASPSAGHAPEPPAPGPSAPETPASVEAVHLLASTLSPRQALEFAERLRSFAEALSAEGVMRLMAATDAALALDVQSVVGSSPGMALSVGSGTLAADAVCQAVSQEVAAVRGIARATASHEVNRARLVVNDSPEVFEALATGTTGVRHAREIADLGLRILPEFVPAPETNDPVAREEYERAVLQAEIECGQRRRSFCRDTLSKSAGKTPGQVRRHAKRRLEQELPEAFEARHRNSRSGRYVSVQEAEDGMSYLSAYIPTTAAEAIERRLSEYARAITHRAAGITPGESSEQPADLLAARVASPGVRPGDSGRGAAESTAAPDEQRSMAQIRADALVDMMLSGPEAVGLANVKPHLTVTVPAPLLVALGASLPDGAGLTAEDPSAGLTDEVPSAGDCRVSAEDSITTGPSPGRAAETAADRQDARASGEPWVGGGVPAEASVEAEALLRFAGLFTCGGTVETERLGAISLIDLRALLPQAATWTRVITDPWTGAITHFDPTAYRVPAALRRAVALRDRTCRIPGCSRRASECETDHVTEYQHGGETRLGNLVSLCKRCHRLKSWGLLTLEISADGVLDVETFWGTRRITLPDAPWEVGTHQRKTPRKIRRNRTVRVPVPADPDMPNADLLLHGPGIMDAPFQFDEPPRALTPEEEQDIERAVENLETALRNELHPPF
ncbi:hypothetical protein GCM10027591_01430 [Zhihengliuella somnathii]